ncbi:MAG: transposase [Butyricicoccus sp.]
MLFRIVLIQHIYGIRSLRRTLEEISMNMAYRWFIGYPLHEQTHTFLLSAITLSIALTQHPWNMFSVGC